MQRILFEDRFAIFVTSCWVQRMMIRWFYGRPSCILNSMANRAHYAVNQSGAIQVVSQGTLSRPKPIPRPTRKRLKTVGVKTRIRTAEGQGTI